MHVDWRRCTGEVGWQWKEGAGGRAVGRLGEGPREG